MNILYLCADRGIPVRGHKGAAVHVRAMIRAFWQAGHEVTLLTPRLGPENGPTPEAEVIHVPLPAWPGDDAEKALAHDRQTQAHSGLMVEVALGLLQQHDIDFIYERYSLWSDAGARLTRRTGLPLVLEVNAPLREEAARYRSLADPVLAAEVESTQFEAAAAIAVVSESLREYVIGRGAQPDRVHVLTNGVDPHRFHPAVRGGSVRGRFGLNDRIVVGFVGRPRPWHDLECLIEAVALLRRDEPRYHLLLVGQMPDDLAESLERHGMAQATTCSGPVAHDQVPRYIAAMDVAVSTHRPQPDLYFSPLKLFEYMACGVPVVAADQGQPAQIVRNGQTGYLYRPGDSASLASRVGLLVEDQAHARQVAWQGAVKVLEHHTWDGNARTVAGWVLPGQAQDPPTETHDVWPRPLSLPILDRKLRQRLLRATRADLVAPLLARRLPAFGKKRPETLERVNGIEVLKYKPGRRCVLAYDLRGKHRQDGSSTRHQVVGKVFRDERGQRLYDLQQQLWLNGFGPDAPDLIRVPQPLAYVPEMRMLVQERAPGATLNQLVDDVHLRDFIPRCAEGLAKLHRTDLQDLRRDLVMTSYHLTDELSSLDRSTQNLAHQRPQSAAAVAELRTALQSWAAQLPPISQPMPVHRDFYYSQVLFQGMSLTMIDFDLLAMGDPAIDVANFTAHLYFLGLDHLADLDALAYEAQLFREAYDCYHTADRAFQQRWAFYQAATLFRLMNVVAPRPALAHHFPTLFRRTADCLEAA